MQSNLTHPEIILVVVLSVGKVVDVHGGDPASLPEQGHLSQPAAPWGCCDADRFARRKKRGKLAAERAASQLARAICQQAHQKDVVISARFRAALAAVSARRSDDGPAAARMCGDGREHPQHTDE